MNSSSIGVIAPIFALVGSLYWVSPGLAQISPDTTLPVNSQAIAQGNTVSIEGGTPAGSNLFHSFTEFNVSTGSEAFFKNSPSIENIFTRITGGQPSHIDGILRANGTANLFLLNPNGIVFGPNARLNLGGSFFASTAESLQFADGSTFSATEPNTPPLLTINVPIGLQLGSNPGTIRVEGSGHQVRQAASIVPLLRSAETRGLQVKPGQTLALVGGDLVFEGGVVTADSGRIELGSAAEGRVGLNSTPSGWQLDYTDSPAFGDIRLLYRSIADASGLGSGSIQIRGGNITLENGSIVLIQNLGMQPAGTIRANASQALEIQGRQLLGTPPSGIWTESLGSGRGGDIEISAQKLTLWDGGGISARTFGDAPGGNQNIQVSESVELRGFLAADPTFNSALNVLAFGNGLGGNLNISTGRFVATDGGLATVANFGAGDSGDLTIRADSIELAGVVPDVFTPSIVASATIGTGRGGDVTIETAQLTVRNSGQVGAGTLGPGDAGNVTIRARASVTVSGSAPGSLDPSLIISSANLTDETTRAVFGLPTRPTGNSGNVRIETPVLNVTDGALVNVQHEGSGDAGTLSIHADRIQLDRHGGITATTLSGEGGNIELLVQDRLQMRHQSQISATAGGTGNGGNINIETPVLVALENSDISANAGQGRGGGIRIKTQGIFGTAFRDTLTPDSDITATSALGTQFDGIVEIQTPGNEPHAEFVELSARPFDADAPIAQGCGSDRGNRFVVTGRGGLPDDPTVTLQDSRSWADTRDWRNLNPQGAVSSFTPPEPHPRVEASGWVHHPDGIVELVAVPPESTWEIRQHCPLGVEPEVEENGYNMD